MENFRRIDMYQCTWCGKIFRTNDRHRCKFRPSYENCFSCEHCKGVTTTTVEGDTYPYKVMACAVKDGVPIPELARKGWELHCPMWKLAEDYKGKETYVKKNVYPYMQRPVFDMAEDPLPDGPDTEDDIPF